MKFNRAAKLRMNLAFCTAPSLYQILNKTVQLVVVNVAATMLHAASDIGICIYTTAVHDIRDGAK